MEPRIQGRKFNCTWNGRRYCRWRELGPTKLSPIEDCSVQLLTSERRFVATPRSQKRKVVYLDRRTGVESFSQTLPVT